MHSNIGYQMDSLKASIGNPRSISRRTRRLLRKSKKKRNNNMSLLSSSLVSLGSNSEPPPSLLDDHEALSAYIIDQMAMMQMQQQTNGTSESLSGGTSPSLANLYTSYLPNVMWYQPIAADSSPSRMIRPTSLCSGTGM